ncbi:MAG: hypothetical protein FWC42_00160 [Proteobacteria bacterium]|nr:hypothetical protein [Pseudomonadota bacterium]
MGNKQSREQTRPNERGKPCTCDVFDLSVACEDDALCLSLTTDLPVNTRVAVSAYRFLSERNSHQWQWTCFEGAVPVKQLQNGLNGFVLRLTNDELDTKGLHVYRHLKRSMNVIIATLSASLEISASAPTTRHRFGLCNRRLTGKAVTVFPSGHLLERLATIDIPISTTVMKQLGL